jgi:hypothetical protein
MVVDLRQQVVPANSLTDPTVQANQPIMKSVPQQQPTPQTNLVQNPTPFYQTDSMNFPIISASLLILFVIICLVKKFLPQNDY